QHTSLSEIILRGPFANLRDRRIKNMLNRAITNMSTKSSKVNTEEPHEPKPVDVDSGDNNTKQNARRSVRRDENGQKHPFEVKEDKKTPTCQQSQPSTFVDCVVAAVGRFAELFASFRTN